mgnify:CR=1 FL=1
MKNTLISALKAAGDIHLQYFDKPLKITEKESISSVVTEVDIKSEKKIIEIIQSDFPNHNILSEECGFIDQKSNYSWIIDPIDGTSNYAAGIPWFGVLIALMENEKPVLGGAYLPVQDQLYFAELGKGATLNEAPIHVTQSPLKDCLFTFATDCTDDQKLLNKGLEIYQYIVMHSRNMRVTNSLLDFLFVAEGKTGGCINLFTKIWDIAPVELILSEADGLFANLSSEELIFKVDENAMHKNYSVIATTEKIFGEFWPLLKG